MNYQKVESKDLKNHGKLLKNGDLHLKEGVYTTFSPIDDNEFFIRVKKEKKETNELINETGI